LVVPPEGGRRRALDGDTPFLLLVHPIHRRLAVVDLADFIRLSGIIQDALGGGRLAGVDVRHDADIAYSFQTH